jgi:dihydroorotate dehydrogenase electron transfer subunit
LPLILPTAVSIVEVQQENYRTKTFVLDARLEAHPGQFVMAWLPRFDEKPFSLLHADPVTLMITAVGPFSGLIHARQPGDRLWIRGPFGHGFHVPQGQRHIVLAAGGYGVAPLHWLAQAQTGVTPHITAIIGARSAADVLYAERFQKLSSSAITRHTLHITTEDGSLGLRGRITDALEPLLASDQIDAIYACGPHGMLRALQSLGQRYHLPCQLSWEAYMRCGIGICGACEHEGRVLCLDGPVLATAG